MPKKKEELTSWKSSMAKKILERDLISGAIPLDAKLMKPKEVYQRHPEFSDFAYDRFPSRLRDLRRQITDKSTSATLDQAALAHDRQLYPKATHNHRGEPRWEGSEAEQLLRLDMDAGKHKIMKPQELYNSRKEFSNNYPLKVFQKHIDQEERRRKMLAYYATKKNKPSSSS